MITDVRVPLEHQQPYPAAYGQLLEKVRYEGAYPTRERAEEAVRLVLAGLGRQLTGDERVGLAACLPLEAARVLTTQIPDTQPLTGWAFVKDLAARTGASLATTRWDTGSVLATVRTYAGPDLTTRILHQLPTAGFCALGKVTRVHRSCAAPVLVGVGLGVAGSDDILSWQVAPGLPLEDQGPSTFLTCRGTT